MPTQTTSVDSNNVGVEYSRAANLPTGAWIAHAWFRVADWSSGGGLSANQLLLDVKLSESWHGVQLHARVDLGTLLLTGVELYDLIEEHTVSSGADDEWLFVALNYDGASTLQFISSPADSSTLTKTTLDTQLASPPLYIKLFHPGDKANHIHLTTVGVWEGTASDAQLLALKATDTEPTLSGLTINSWSAFDDVAAGHDDTSGNGYGFFKYIPGGDPAEVDDSPYSSAPEFGGTDTECASEAGSGNLTQCHALGGTAVECSSEAGSGNVTQRHAIGATDTECLSEVGSGALLQLHLLGGTGIECSAEVGSGAIAGTDLGGVDIECLSEAGSGALAQNHAFGGTGVECASAVGSGILPAVDGVEFVPAERRFAIIREIRSFTVLAESRMMRA
jgi:hypothetical protein